MAIKKRFDGLTFKVSESNGEFFIDLINDNGVISDGWAISFKTKEDALRAIEIANRSFEQGYRFAKGL